MGSIFRLAVFVTLCCSVGAYFKEMNKHTMTPTLDISVIICTYTENRWDDLVAAINSVRQQTLPPSEIIVVVDHNPALLQRVRQCLPEVVAAANKGGQGVSEARNSGAAIAQGQIIAFLDDDALASPDWLEWLAPRCSLAQVLGVGGSIEPIWLDHRPRWFPEEFYWVVGGTYKGMPQITTAVRNVWTGNMCIHRNVFESIGGFRAGFGKVGTRSCPEDTDLCIRALQHWPRGKWLYEPGARVLHKVPTSRSSWRYYIWRCYNEGLGKAQLSNLVGAADGMGAERKHALYTLPRGVGRGLADVFLRRDLTGLGRAAAILAGLMMATAGYLKGSFELMRATGGPERKVAPVH